MVYQFIANGAITGILYGLLAAGFALVYNTTKVFHIATAALFVASAYVFYLFSNLLGWPLWLAVAVALGATSGLSCLCEKAVYAPLKRRNATSDVALIASIGVMTILTNLIALLFGNDTKSITTDLQQVHTFGRIYLSEPQLWQLALGGGAGVLLVAYLHLTPRGLRLRALSSDEGLFATLGNNVASARTGVFALSGLLVGATGCLTTYEVGMDPNMGMPILVNALVAMIMGGSGRIGMSLVGGVLLGMLQGVVVWRFESSWQNAITFAVLLILLLFRPQGIAGYKRRTI